MADPLFGVSIFEMLARDARHESDLDQTLSEFRRLMDHERIPFAMIGGLVLPHHGYDRHTEDIDVLTTEEGLAEIHEKVLGREFVLREPGSRSKLRHGIHRVDIDIVRAGQHAGCKGSPLVFPDPRSDAFEFRGDLRIPRLETMINLKVVSGVWGHRLKDLGDAIELIKANRLDEAFAAKLIPEVREKFVELVGESRQEITLEG